MLDTHQFPPTPLTLPGDPYFTKDFTTLMRTPDRREPVRCGTTCQRKGCIQRSGRGLTSPDAGSARGWHGLRTPPRDMSGTETNPLLPPNLVVLPYSSVPVGGSNAPSYPSIQATLPPPRYQNKPEPFYASYKSANRSQSPTPVRRDGVLSHEPPTRRRKSSEGNSIVSYLQIPPSINDSQGSLAEFTAQVRFSYQSVP